MNWKAILEYCGRHWIVIFDFAAAVAAWVMGFSTIGFYPWVPAIPALWLLGRTLYFRGKLGQYLAPSIRPPQ